MILDEIIAHKRTEVAAAASRVSLAELTARTVDASPVRDFHAALRSPKGRIGLIAEVKKASPSAGIIAPGFDPVRTATQYEAAGADCLSVLTDARYFQGSLADMQAARSAVSIPVLRKDFVISEYQVHEARAAGADCILLIVAALTPTEIADYHACATDLGLSVLVETHTEDEMRIALDSGATLIGINSRNLQTFVTDLGVIDRVAALVPPGITLVAESGIKTRADVDRVASGGAHAILVGETLMRSGNVAAGVAELVGR
ncbi:MAG TPA: indole-3-glycerol phosphate synthase TrpC [Capsulimonadaceae bacterium]|jgi:indole-3-glycerol phosphate synthase